MMETPSLVMDVAPTAVQTKAAATGYWTPPVSSATTAIWRTGTDVKLLVCWPDAATTFLIQRKLAMTATSIAMMAATKFAARTKPVAMAFPTLSKASNAMTGDF